MRGRRWAKQVEIFQKSFESPLLFSICLVQELDNLNDRLTRPPYGIAGRHASRPTYLPTSHLLASAVALSTQVYMDEGPYIGATRWLPAKLNAAYGGVDKS